jgi:hypothetical protein
MTFSDVDCDKMVDVYYNNQNPACKANAKERICGRARRDNIDCKTGNYYTENGVLI